MPDLIAALLVLTLVIWLVRRLVGVRHGHWVRTIGATVIALLGAWATISLANQDLLARADLQHLSEADKGVAYGIFVLYSVLATVFLEMLLRPRRGGLRIPHPLHAVRLMGERAVRYVQIMRLAVRHGVIGRRKRPDTVVGSQLGRALTDMCEDAGGIFVKLGQALAAQPQLVTPAVAAELERLQEQAAPADPVAARQVLREELGDLDLVFAHIDDEPIGSASIGQIYLARLLDGSEVVVKVQRPRVAETIERDLDILMRLADRIDRSLAEGDSLDVRELIAGFAERTREELDFRKEAANMIAAAKELDDGAAVTVPGLVESLTTARVLVQRRAPGCGVASPGALDGLTPAQREGLADELLGFELRRMLAGDVFHGDPHPGNVFVFEGRLILIDWGSVGQLDPFERSGLIDFFRALQTNDPALLREGALKIGSASRRIDEDAMDRQMARLLQLGITPDGTLSNEFFAAVITVLQDFGVSLPRSTATLLRTLATLMGTLNVLSPAYPLVEAGQRIGGSLAQDTLMPDDLQQFLLQEVLNNGEVLRRLPRELDGVMRAVMRGELRTRVSILSEPQDVREARRLVNRVVVGLVGGALALASASMIAASAGPKITADLTIVNLVGAVGLCFALVLLSRLLIEILHEQD